MKNISYLFILFIFVNSCKKETVFPPTIEFISMTPSNVTEFKDSIDIVIKYTDKDGDIGIPDADVKSLWVLDSRLTVADEYFLKPLAPLDEKIAITGNYVIKLKTIFRLGEDPFEKTKFTIWIKDRAGNKSNVIETSELTINK